MGSGPLLLAACCFAFVSGANDGAALLAANLGSKAFRPLTALMLLVATIVIAPFVLGTGVAATLAAGLVRFDRAGGDEALLIAVAVAVGLVALLGRLGFPTSMTHALAGAAIGVGLGRHLPVDGGVALRVVLVLVAAPLLAGALGWLAAAVLGRFRPRHGVRRRVRSLETLAWLAQCVAYAANDAQKLTAIAAIALGLGVGSAAVGTTWPAQVAIGLLFLAGALAGASRLGRRIGRLLEITPMTAVGAGYGASVAVLWSAALGLPVSTSQATASALVGAQSIVGGYRRVRWEQAVRLLSTWVTTFPTALAAAALVGWGTAR